MSNIQYGCQTYTWQMNIGKYQGQFEHFLKVLSMAGYTGIEAEVCMLGDFYHDWQRTKDLLDQYNVRFTALAFHLPWLNEKETEEEFAAANKAIEFLSHFPTAKLMLAHAAADPVREHNLREKQRNQLNCLTSIGQRAMECGVVPVFHPNSAPNSIFRYAQDYEIMFEALYKSPVGYAPDVGHMANGDIDPLETIRTHRGKIAHVHFKDMNAQHEWVTMGNGIIDFKGIIDYLNSTDYRGWIVVEDESADAIAASDDVVLAGGKYIAANQ